MSYALIHETAKVFAALNLALDVLVSVCGCCRPEPCLQLGLVDAPLKISFPQEGAWSFRFMIGIISVYANCVLSQCLLLVGEPGHELPSPSYLCVSDKLCIPLTDYFRLSRGLYLNYSLVHLQRENTFFNGSAFWLFTGIEAANQLLNNRSRRTTGKVKIVTCLLSMVAHREKRRQNI